MLNNNSAHSLPRILARFGIGSLGQNTLLSTVGLVIRALIQAGYLIVLSRWMGVEEYGLFAGSLALAVVVMPLSGWGIGHVLSRRLALAPNRLPSLWATALVQIAASGLVLTALTMLISSLVLDSGITNGSMLLLGLSELIALPLTHVAASTCLALNYGRLAAVITCLVPSGRLLIVIAFMLAEWDGAASEVAALHFSGTMLGAAVALFIVVSIGGAPAWRSRLPSRIAGAEGTSYAMGSLAGKSYQEVDKVLLLQILGSVAVGNYTAAFRVMSVLVLPISALVGAALPRLFALHGNTSYPRIFRLIVVTSTCYAVVSMIFAIAISPWMPDIFGNEFSASSEYLFLLSFWAILFSMHHTAGLALTTSGLQLHRVIIEAVGVSILVLAHLRFLAEYGVEAAIFSLLAVEFLMATACWAIVAHRKLGRTPKNLR